MQKVFDLVTVAVMRARTFELGDLSREDGQGAVEYALVVLGIGAVVGLAIAGFGGQITSFMSLAGAKLATYV
jgi:Flp pilus assembly pilin Flp